MACVAAITGQYCTDCDVYKVFGQQNIAIWSDLSGLNTLDSDRLTYAMTWAASEVSACFRVDGNYTDPIVFTDSDAIKGSVWCAKLTGIFLYESRGLRDDDNEANKFDTMKKDVYADFAKYQATQRLHASRRWPQSTAPIGWSQRGI